MDEQRFQVLVVVCKRPVAQPLNVIGNVVGVDNLFQRFESLRVGYRPCRERQQMQVVIAEHADDGVAETARIGRERGATHLRLTVDAANANAKSFYERLGMEHRDKEDTYHIGGAPFDNLAGDNV